MLAYEDAKAALIKDGESTRYFSRKTYHTILKERKLAYEALERCDDPQEVYQNGDTVRTKFYNENGCAYCRLLEHVYASEKGVNA